MNDYVAPTPSKLLAAAEAYFNHHAPSMSIRDVAQWTYLRPAVDTMLAHLHLWPMVSEEYMDRVKHIDASFGRGILTRSEYMEYHREAAMEALDQCDSIDQDPMYQDRRFIDLAEVGETFFDDDVLHLWMVTGFIVNDDWCAHIPWSPAISKALEHYTMFLTVDEAMDVAKQWHPGEWSEMHTLATTGRYTDHEALYKELDECLCEAGDNPLYATRLYNLVAWVTIDTYLHAGPDFYEETY